MISVLAVALLMAPDTADAALDRLAKFVEKSPVLQVDLEARISGQQEVGKGSLAFRKPGFQIYKMNWYGSDYEYRQVPNSSIVYDHQSKVYEIWFPFPTLGLPPTELSEAAPYGYPMVLLQGDVRKASPELKWSLVGSEDLAGIPTARLHSKLDTMFGPIENSMWIDGAGRLLRMDWTRLRDDEPLTTRVDLSNYRTSAPAESEFEPELLWGYVPRTTGEMPGQHVAGDEVPFGEWKDARNGKLVATGTLAKGKYVALVFTQPDDPISDRMEKSLRELSSKLAAKKGELWEVSVGSDAPKLGAKDPKRRVFWDDQSRLAEELHVDGTPHVYLVHPTSVVVIGWQGADDSQPSAMVARILKGLEVVPNPALAPGAKPPTTPPKTKKPLPGPRRS